MVMLPPIHVWKMWRTPLKYIKNYKKKFEKLSLCSGVMTKTMSLRIYKLYDALYTIRFSDFKSTITQGRINAFRFCKKFHVAIISPCENNTTLNIVNPWLGTLPKPPLNHLIASSWYSLYWSLNNYVLTILLLELK